MTTPPVTPSFDDDSPGWLGRRLGRHLGEMLRLAPPIVMARSGIVVMILVDTVMVGRHSVLELGYLAMGMSLIQPILVTSLGLIMGTLVLTANHYGAERFTECGAVWRRSVVYALGLGGIGVGISLFGETILTFTGQTEDLAREGGRTMLILGFGLPAHLVFLATTFFLEGIRRPMPGVWFMILANLVNFGLNWMLIGSQGAEGAAWATTAARWVLALGMVGHVLTMRGHEAFAVRTAPGGGWTAWKHQRRLGYAMGVSLAVEAFAFTTIQQFAGWLGPVQLAAFTAAFYLLVTSFMVAIGFGAATTVRVGIAYGRGDHRDVALAGWTGLGLTAVATALIGVILLVFDAQLAEFFTRDAVVMTAATALVFWVAMALVTDGGQAVMANALRGRQDVWASCLCQAIAFLGVMVPVSWYLTFPLGQGAAGLFQGVLIAATVALLLLGLRFHWLFRRDGREAAAPPKD